MANIKNKYDKSRKEFWNKEIRKPEYYIAVLLFVIYAISLIYPLIWVFIESLRDKIDFFWYPLQFSGNLSLNNYLSVFETYDIISMFINSIILSVGGTFSTLLVSSMAAYVVAKYKFATRNLIYSIVIMTMIIPTTGSIATTYKLMSDLNLMGSHVGVIIMYSGGFGFNFFLLYGFFKGVSETYAEAAKIDGASHITIFFKIMIPLAVPSLLAVALIQFIGLWNDYYAPYMYLRSYPTLAVGMYQLSSDITTGANAYDYPGLFAIMIISILPIIVLFSIFQNKIMENTIAGGIKG